MLEENVVVVKDVYKSFRLPHENNSGIKQLAINILRRNRNKGYEIQKVLKGVSFEVKRGDFFGIVGRNGSGKSTLLKLLAGIYGPESGQITTTGSIVPFIELGVGFNPELTGKENIYLNGALLGFSHEEINDMYKEIVGFAELENFMDQKLKNYSSGMQVRLAFSIAIQAKGDILILDEVLAVGDEAFQRKCDNFFTQIKKDKTKTIILVTHSMGSVKKYCNRAILIKDGDIIASGDPDDIANQYTEENFAKDTLKKVGDDGSFEVGLNDLVPLLKTVATSKNVLSSDETFSFDIQYDYRGNEDIFLAFSMIDSQRGGITYDSGSLPAKKGNNSVEFKIPLSLFNSTDFNITATIRVKDEIDTKETRMIAFTNEDNQLFFSVRNKKEKSNYALLRNDILKVEQTSD